VHDYRFDKSRVPITVRLLGGEELRGTLFAQASQFRARGHEEPIDLLNDPEPFFPLEREDGVVVLIPKARVLELRGVGLSPEDELRRASVRAVEVVVRLVDGADRTGTLLLEMPSDRPRVLDYLNHSAERFLTLFGKDEVQILNAEAIEYVRPLD
jgi:hypothetical protein